MFKKLSFHYQRVIQRSFWGAVVQRNAIMTVIKHSTKQLRICIECVYFTELMLWLHRVSFAGLQVTKYMRTDRTYLGKKIVFKFLGADFLAPKSSHRREKQPVLGPDYAAESTYY